MDEGSHGNVEGDGDTTSPAAGWMSWEAAKALWSDSASDIGPQTIISMCSHPLTGLGTKATPLLPLNL